MNLQSIYANPLDQPFEIIVVDNHSTDGTVIMVEKDFSDIKLIVNQDNLGFTYPMNQALRSANGDYLLL